VHRQRVEREMTPASGINGLNFEKHSDEDTLSDNFTYSETLFPMKPRANAKSNTRTLSGINGCKTLGIMSYCVIYHVASRVSTHP